MGTNETSGEVMVNGEVKNTSSTPVVSITNPSIDSTSPSNSSGGKQVSVDGQTKISYAQITQKKKEEREAKLAAEKAAAASNATSTPSGSAATNAEPANSDNTKIVKEQPAVKTTNQFHGGESNPPFMASD